MLKINVCPLLAVPFLIAPMQAQIGPEFLSHQPLSVEEECQTCPSHQCGRRRNRWKEDHFLEQQFQDSAWPARRDDELSDQLGR